VTDARVMTIGQPPTFRQQVARALGTDSEGVGWMPSVSAVEGSLGAAPASPDVLVLSPAIKESDAYGLSEFVGRTSPTTAVLLVRDRELNGTLAAAMRSGIRDVVDLSKGSDEFREALRRAIDWSQNLRSIGRDGPSKGEVRQGKMYSVFSSKGGTGKTFLSINLAAAIAAEAKQDTAVVDLDLDLGDVFSYFGKEPTQPMQDLITLSEDDDQDQVKAVGSRFYPHLWGYGSPYDPTASPVGGETMGKLLRALRRTFDYTVIDATTDYSDATLAAFDLSEEIYLIAGLDIVGVRHLSVSLQTLLSLGYPRERFRLVLNRSDSKVGLSPSEVERVMKVKIDTQIPSSRLVPVSLNAGTPVVVEAPKSAVAKSVHALARRLVLDPVAGAERKSFAASR
jgi:pilus assembly protein CpaE